MKRCATMKQLYNMTPGHMVSQLAKKHSMHAQSRALHIVSALYGMTTK